MRLLGLAFLLAGGFKRVLERGFRCGGLRPLQLVGGVAGLGLLRLELGLHDG